MLLALTGQNIIAQCGALGKRFSNLSKPCMGVITISPFQGYVFVPLFFTQRFALGFYISFFQNFDMNKNVENFIIEIGYAIGRSNPEFSGYTP